MPIIDNARGGAQQPPPPEQMPQDQQPPQAGPGNEPPSEQAKDVVLACLAMLYDKRIAMGLKIAEQMRSSRDPAAIIAHSAHDIVASAIEKTGIALAPAEFKRTAAMVLKHLAEIAAAAGIELTEDDAAAAGEMMRMRAEGGDAVQADGPQPQPGAGAPPQQQQMEMQQ